MKLCYKVVADDGSIAGTADVIFAGHECYFDYFITAVLVKPNMRRRGYGTKLLQEICKEADAIKASLALDVLSSGEMTNEELKNWYWKFGFIISDDMMIRKAKK
jgi:ribosomal protein S18 acetylase RimI-like enzyme